MAKLRINPLRAKDTLLAAISAGAMNAAQLQANGFMSGEALKSLSVATSILAIANLRNLDDMLDQGKVGSAGATVYQAQTRCTTHRRTHKAKHSRSDRACRASRNHTKQGATHA